MPETLYEVQEARKREREAREGWPVTIVWVLERRKRGPFHRLLVWWCNRG